jgi:protein TonB
LLSALAHAGIYAAFDRPPPPQTSVGEIAISVEIVLGSEHAAGLSQRPTETEATDAAASNPSQPQRAAETPLETVAAPPLLKPEPKPEESKTEIAKVEPELCPSHRKSNRKRRRRPLRKRHPSRHPEQKEPVSEQPTARKTDSAERTPSRAAVASQASESSSGIGRGFSDADTNYRGRVAAHLARHKRFPEEARQRRQRGNRLSGQ